MSSREKAYVPPTDTSPPDVAAIYEQHKAPLQGYITKRVAFREDAEDILQTVFYRLSKIDLTENPIEQISAWLYSVARNLIIDRHRKHREESLPKIKKRAEDTDFINDISELLAGSDDDDPETSYLRSLVWDELETALAELPSEQRAVYELTELEGFSFADIAESTGVPLNTLISRKRYAVLHLRERLRDIYDQIIKKD